MTLVGRRAELRELDQLLEQALGGAGGLLAVVGPSGSGKTALLAAAAAAGRRRGFETLAGSWEQLLRDVGAPPAEDDLDAAARRLAAGERRLLLVDDVDRRGPAALELLALLAARLVAGTTAVVVTARRPLGVGTELRLGGLSEDDLAAAVGVGDDARHAVWAASGGLPGVARGLAARLSDRPDERDATVHLALGARPSTRFLDVDAAYVRLLEAALGRAEGDAVGARLRARLARALLGDATAGPRRRALVEEALALARAAGDRQALAEALDARLYALWDPAAARERLDAAAEIADLGEERTGLFWRFVALMELGRVAEAESALAAYDRAVRATHDTVGEVVVVARQAMLATLRGRFAEALQLAGEVAERGAAAGMPDAQALSHTLRGAVMMLREDLPSDTDLQMLRRLARELPGQLFEATLARALAGAGRLGEAAAELERVLARALAGSGPRWLGAMADLAAVAVATGDRAAAARLYDALAPFRGRLVVWGAANSVTGPVSHYLGLLAGALGRRAESAELLAESMAWAEQAGALPFAAHSLRALDDARARRRAREIAARLGMRGLQAADEWTLRREGDDWLLEAGPERARLRDIRGLHHLRALLAAPGRDIAALDLAAGGAGLAAPRHSRALDDAALRAYRRRLAALDAELDAADTAGDVDGSARAQAERDALLRELRAASGLGGRVRRAPAEAERARVNVTRTLRAALERLAQDAPRAAAHLDASIRTGLACRYEPAPGGPARWHV